MDEEYLIARLNLHSSHPNHLSTSESERWQRRLDYRARPTSSSPIISLQSYPVTAILCNADPWNIACILGTSCHQPGVNRENGESTTAFVIVDHRHEHVRMVRNGITEVENAKERWQLGFA